uniref:Putative stress-induced protein 8-like n=1 Tax=Solanum chacoense TaxID=4108 RepID=A0A0V0GH33_SOLCH
MAAVVDACVCEITKISEKVRAKSLFLLKKKKTGEKVEERQNSSSSVEMAAESKNDNIMCEATVFLLMDRFAPC